MTDQRQRLDNLVEEIEELEAELQDRDDKDKADLEQLRAIEAAKRDLKRAGGKLGYANANRKMEQAETRLDGIRATCDL